MKPVRTTKREAWRYAKARIPFKTNGSLRGEFVQNRYVVYSYNAPIYIYDPEMKRWFENSHYHGFSVTTSSHYSSARPLGVGEIIAVSGETFNCIQRHGAAYAAAEQLAGGAA